MSSKKLIVVGGGAAGFFCAVNAAKLNPKLRVTIVERSSKLLGKVKISGGGRCNVTHDCDSISEMVKKYPRGASFLKKAFHHFFTSHTIQWFAERGVELKTEADGRMFPVTDDSQTIVDCLLREANKYKVEILLNAGVTQIVKHKMAKGFQEAVNEKRDTVTANDESVGKIFFELTLENGKVIPTDYVCIACGGYPKPAQYNWLTDLGHTVEPPVPSLFTFNIPGQSITGLMGISVENICVKIAGTKLQQEAALLITHWGISGPAVLKLSAWAARELAEKKYEYNVLLNWLPHYNENSLREKIQQLRFEIASQKIYNRNPFGLPARLWDYFLQLSGVGDIRWADLPAKEQNKLIKTLAAQEIPVRGKTTFKEEFATAGGIKLDEIDVNTMQSKILPGLFFAGEIINVDGVTGGFNFQNAWTTGWIAAKAIAQNL